METNNFSTGSSNGRKFVKSTLYGWESAILLRQKLEILMRELNSSTEIGLTLTILKALIRTIKPLNLNAPLYCKNKEYERIDKCFHDLTKVIGSLSQENALEISFMGSKYEPLFHSLVLKNQGSTS